MDSVAKMPDVVLLEKKYIITVNLTESNVVLDFCQSQHYATYSKNGIWCEIRFAEMSDAIKRAADSMHIPKSEKTTLRKHIEKLVLNAK